MALGWRGDANAVHEREAVAYSARSFLEEVCMMLDLVGDFAVWKYA